MSIDYTNWSSIYTEILRLVLNGTLQEPFRAADIRAVSNILKSNGFLAKHAVGNPGGLNPYFIRVEEGLYRCLRPPLVR